MSLGARTILDREYAGIRDDLLRLSELVDSAIEQAMNALKSVDTELARQIIQNDMQVNNLRFKIEENSMRLLATQQPAARDLRAIVAVLHLVAELERIGDHAAGIAKTVTLMEKAPPPKTLKKLTTMADLSRQMMKDSMQAFLQRDAEWARQIALEDPLMDELYKEVFDRIVKVMAKHPELIKRGTYIMWCAHNLERIADRVTNIAERVVYMVTGEMRELNM